MLGPVAFGDYRDIDGLVDAEVQGYAGSDEAGTCRVFQVRLMTSDVGARFREGRAIATLAVAVHKYFVNLDARTSGNDPSPYLEFGIPGIQYERVDQIQRAKEVWFRHRFNR